MNTPDTGFPVSGLLFYVRNQLRNPTNKTARTGYFVNS